MIEKKIKEETFDVHSNGKKYHLNSKKLFGLWIYLMSDCIFFAVLFSVYAINTFHFPKYLLIDNFFNLPSVFLETFILLLSSLSCGMIVIEKNKKNIKMIYLYLIITFLLGLFFLSIEINEFYELIKQNYGPTKHAFFSSFFALIGMHGIHISIGLVWIVSMIYQLLRLGLTNNIRTRLLCFSLFWHFLDIIWICIFTFVYLNGVI